MLWRLKSPWTQQHCQFSLTSVMQLREHWRGDWGPCVKLQLRLSKLDLSSWSSVIAPMTWYFKLLGCNMVSSSLGSTSKSLCSFLELQCVHWLLGAAVAFCCCLRQELFCWSIAGANKTCYSCAVSCRGSASPPHLEWIAHVSFYNCRYCPMLQYPSVCLSYWLRCQVLALPCLPSY